MKKRNTKKMFEVEVLLGKLSELLSSDLTDAEFLYVKSLKSFFEKVSEDLGDILRLPFSEEKKEICLKSLISLHLACRSAASEEERILAERQKARYLEDVDDFFIAMSYGFNEEELVMPTVHPPNNIIVNFLSFWNNN